MLFVYIQCDDFIEKYGDKIIKLIVNHTDPDTICSLIQLCTSSSVQLKDTGVFVYLCLYMFVSMSLSVFISLCLCVCVYRSLCLYLCVCVSVSVQGFI